MRLDPFEHVNSRPFSISRAEVLRIHGTPQREFRNEIGLDELDYGVVVYRFQASGRLEEVTVHAPVVHLGAVSVPFASLDAFVREQDPSSFRRAGFLISPRFGLAFDATEPSWVTALARHCVAQWETL